MSKISFRPRGGQEGIEVTTKELEVFSGKLGKQFIDEVIPLPNISPEKQKLFLEMCPCTADQIYWERDNGKHGWCCSDCGTVTQWG